MQGDATHLAGYGYLSMFLEANWTFRAIRVVKYDGDAGFGDPGLATLVYQVLLICGAHLGRKTRYLKCLFGGIGREGTWAIFVMPRTKQIASRMLDLPEPLRPVMALKEGSQPVI